MGIKFVICTENFEGKLICETSLISEYKSYLEEAIDILEEFNKLKSSDDYDRQNDEEYKLKLKYVSERLYENWEEGEIFNLYNMIKDGNIDDYQKGKEEIEALIEHRHEKVEMPYLFEKGICYYHINSACLKSIKNYDKLPLELETAKENSKGWGQGFRLYEEDYELENFKGFLSKFKKREDNNKWCYCSYGYELGDGGKISSEGEINEGVPFAVVSMWD